MGTETIRGRQVTDAQIQSWADEAERGYDVDILRRRGRPPVGAGASVVVSTRLDEPTLAALRRRADAEGLHGTGEALRAAVRAWANVA